MELGQYGNAEKTIAAAFEHLRSARYRAVLARQKGIVYLMKQEIEKAIAEFKNAKSATCAYSLRELVNQKLGRDKEALADALKSGSLRNHIEF